MGTRRVAIGLDIGGTKIAGGLVDVSTGRVLERLVSPTNSDRAPRVVFEDIWRVASTLATTSNEWSLDDVPVGIGVPELVDPQGSIRSDHVLDWSGFAAEANIAAPNSHVIGSDVRVAALAESRFGAGRNASSFLYISIGTGISCCLVLDGKPVVGHRGNALVLASSSRDGINPEEIASGPGLVARYRELSGIALPGAEDVLARREDPLVLQVVHEAISAIAVNIALAIDILDPERVVIGGGLGSAPGIYFDSLVPAVRERIWAEETRELSFVQAELGANAGIIGAAVAAWSAANQRVPEGISK